MISFSDRDVLNDIEQDIVDNSDKGFKSAKKTYRRVFDRKNRTSKAIDKFGDPYFASDEDDETQSISITLPKSLIEWINDYCKQHKITRSRLIRKMCEYSFNLELEKD